MISLVVACCWAALSAEPVSLSWPVAASSALIADCLMLMPYFSSGSNSPLNAEPRASTASLVVPPKVAARSAPTPTNFSVLPASCSTCTPWFLNSAPSRLAFSRYSLALRP